MEIEKIDFLEISLLFGLCRGMKKMHIFFIFYTSVSIATTIFYFKHSPAIFLVGNGAIWNCHTKEATLEMFVVMQYYKRLG